MPFTVTRGQEILPANSTTFFQVASNLPDTGDAFANTFSRATNVCGGSNGPSAGSAVAKTNALLAAAGYPTVDASGLVGVQKLNSSDTVDHSLYWEAVRFPTLGPNAVIVRYRNNVTILSANTDQTEIVGSTGTIDINKCVPIITYTRNGLASASWNTGKAVASLAINAGNVEVTLTRAGGTGTSASYGVVVLEFTGANWGVQTVTSSTTTAGADNAEAISDIGDWSQAFIIHSNRCQTASTGCDEISMSVRPGSDTDEVFFRFAAGAVIGGFLNRAFIINNTEIFVQHIDSITGGGTQIPAGTIAQSENRAFGTVVDTMRTMVFADTLTNDSGANYGRAHFGYRLFDSSNIEFFRGRAGATAEFSAQIVEFPFESSAKRLMVMGVGQ